MIEVKAMGVDGTLNTCKLCESILLPKMLFLVHTRSQAGPIHTMESNFNFSICLSCIISMKKVLEEQE